MKKNLIFFCCLLMSLTLLAQSPAKFSYQSVIHNTDGSYARNQSIGVRVSILKGSATGNVVYSETHKATTNSNGLLILTIGDGVSSQNLTDIDWSDGLFFIKSEFDLSGGTDYQLENTTQLLSVPFAMYAQKTSDSYKIDLLENVVKDLQQKVDTIDSITVKVNSVEISDIMDKLVTSVKLEGNWYVNLGQTEKFKATPAPFASSKLRWSSSDPDIATVENGVVYGVSPGVATITVCSKYDETIKDAMEIYVGLPGLFSVSATEKARFLCGTLYGTYYFSSGMGYGTMGGNYSYYTSQLTGATAPFNSEFKQTTINNLLGEWDLPSKEQLDYILNSRPNAENLYGFAVINIYKGLIILPDNWVAPESISFTPQGDFSTNDYTLKEWKQMELAGAVFLPASGYSSSTTWNSGDGQALYMCSGAAYSSDYGSYGYQGVYKADVLGISNGNCGISNRALAEYAGNGYWSYYNLSYRLIQTVK